MRVNKENYFSKEVSREYLSTSTIKGIKECEAREYASLWLGYEKPSVAAFIEGQYLHAWNEGELALLKFKQYHPELYSTRGAKDLLAKYKYINETISFLQKDNNFMKTLSGKKEVIVTGEIFGIKMKGQIDSLNTDIGYFADLKFMKSIREKKWNDKLQRRVNFVENYDYILQMAIYQELIRQNYNDTLEAFIAAVSKEQPCDKEIIRFDNEDLECRLRQLEVELPRVIDVWKNKIPANELERCEVCEYCRSTKTIKKAKHWSEI